MAVRDPRQASPVRRVNARWHKFLDAANPNALRVYYSYPMTHVGYPPGWVSKLRNHRFPDYIPFDPFLYEAPNVSCPLPYDLLALSLCQFVLVDYKHRSTGVGIEMLAARQWGIPIYGVSSIDDTDMRPSAMVVPMIDGYLDHENVVPFLKLECANRQAKFQSKEAA